MSDEIKVTVVKFPDRDNLMLRYFDPMTGRPKHKSAATADRKQAIKAAGKWEAELREGRYKPALKKLWADFREAYEDAAAELADSTQQVMTTTFNAIEEHLQPKRLSDLTPGRLECLAKTLRDGRSPATVACYLRHLRTALGWAKRAGMLTELPSFPKTPRGATTQARGAAIVGEQFDRILARVDSVVGPLASDSWLWLLRGLWESGLRLSEALRLSWDGEGDKSIRVVDVDCADPMLYFGPRSQKNGREQFWAMPLGFARLLRSVPRDDRRGRVFVLVNQDGRQGRFTPNRVSAVITAMAEAAGISTGVDFKGRTRWATAHDMRRSFAVRLARHLPPAVLKDVMRHSSLETTARFYLTLDAKRTGAELRKADESIRGNSLGNTRGENPSVSGQKNGS